MIPRPTLRLVARARGLSQSDLARLAGVSRQAVSLWFRQKGGGPIRLRGESWLRLAAGLGLRLEELAREAGPAEAERRRLEAALLWDRLFPDLEALGAALARGDDRALARLVEVYGLFRAARAAGPAVWRRFPEYGRYLPPGRREGLARVWRISRA